MTSNACSVPLIALLVVIASARASAQIAAPAAAPATAATPRSIQYGVKFGPAFTSLSSIETLDASAAAAAIEPTMNFGGFVTVNIVGPLDFQPELLFAAKGHRIHDRDAQPTLTGSGSKPPQADRVILVRYLEIPLLLRASRQRRPGTSLFVIGGPALAMRRNAVIREVADPGKHEDIGAAVSRNNLSIVFGAGLQHDRWLVDARMTRGLRNVAVFPQPAEVKTSAFAVMLGVRLR